VAGRAIGIVMGLRLTAHPFVLHPTFERLSKLPWPEQLAELKKEEIKQTILNEAPNERGVFEHYVTTSFDKMYLLSETGYEPNPEESLAAVAKRKGMEPKELAYECLLAEEGTGSLYFPLFNYSEGNLDMLHTLHKHPLTHMGLSDGGAHCGAICDGGMPTFMLTHWTRDRSRGEKMELEYVIHRQTQRTAELYGLGDRGVLAPGYRADVNLLDYDQLALDAPQVVYDLPAGGRRLIQRAQGYRMTLCHGEITFRDGQPTGVMPGRLIRGTR
jgi:N-acyl-D-aspartate/D-glutamate deacylase